MGKQPHRDAGTNGAGTAGDGTGRVNPRSPRDTLQPEMVPAPPPPSRLARHPVVVVLNGLLTFIVLAVIAIGIGLYWGKERFEAPGPLTEARTLLITRGTNSEAIANQLERHGIIENKWVFLGALTALKAQSRLKAGEYLFKPQISMREVMETLVDGRSIEYAVTVPEGLTTEQIIERIRADEVLVGDIEKVPAEGTLLPETYKFTRGTSREQIVERMRRAHDKAVEDIWARRAEGLPIRTPDELVVLASIVEKETGRSDERSRVAAVFINRLKKNMRLQSDPTIIYGLAGGKGSLGRPILRSELDKATPYNTYLVDGLPPGPIANPGRAAMEAVANPSRTDDLYFVADGTGGHSFAASYEDHQANVARWRRIERKRSDEAAKAAGATAPAADADTGDDAADAAAADGGNSDITDPDITDPDVADPAVPPAPGKAKKPIKELEGEVRGSIRAVPVNPLGGLDIRVPR